MAEVFNLPTKEQFDTMNSHLANISIPDAAKVTIEDTGSHYTSGNVEGALQEVGAQINDLADDVIAHKADVTTYSTYKLNSDVNGIFTEIQYKRPNGTIILKSVLSGGVSPEYTTRTETEYEQNGTTIKSTRVYKITYFDGVVTSEVLQ